MSIEVEERKKWYRNHHWQKLRTRQDRETWKENSPAIDNL